MIHRGELNDPSCQICNLCIDINHEEQEMQQQNQKQWMFQPEKTQKRLKY